MDQENADHRLAAVADATEMDAARLALEVEAVPQVQVQVAWRWKWRSSQHSKKIGSRTMTPSCQPHDLWL